MSDPRAPIYAAIQLRADPDRWLDQTYRDALDNVLDALGVVRPAQAKPKPMDVAALQARLGVYVDNVFGPIGQAALDVAFSNTNAPAVTPQEIQAVATRLGCSVLQVRAVAKVESSGASYDKKGRPKILFERHKFHAATGGRWSPSTFSNRIAGGYSEDSWQKLKSACARDPHAAFSSCSWGRFQVMGFHWESLGFDSPYDLAISTVANEAAHYELLVRYVETNALQRAMRAISEDPETCRPFAKGFNGPGYAADGYHTKLAAEMRQ